MMEVTIYTAPGCDACVHLKTLLVRANLEWNEIVIGQDMSMNSFRTKFPQVKSTPYTVIDKKNYPSIVDVARMLLKEGLVTPPSDSE